MVIYELCQLLRFFFQIIGQFKPVEVISTFLGVLFIQALFYNHPRFSISFSLALETLNVRRVFI
jgi:hypothetical protein